MNFVIIILLLPIDVKTYYFSIPKGGRGGEQRDRAPLPYVVMDITAKLNVNLPFL